ncbi:MAG: hypothetical protein LBI86_06755, partial [Treponema sp.]|nr:hypothetical protein [Treponema sp.]
SPAIGAGSNGFYPPSAWAAWDSWITSLAGSNPVSRPVFERFIAPALSKDPAGNNRVQGTIDMGAYERQ